MASVNDTPQLVLPLGKVCACGCGRPSKHYFIQGHNGKDQPEESRFWKYVDKNGPLWNGTPCWIWMGGRTGNDYGAFKTDNGNMVSSHRYAYESVIGPIEHGKVPDHLCRNHPCCNPIHLEPVTQRTNTLRGVSPTVLLHHARMCNKGHLLTPENTQVIESSTEGRIERCKICQREAGARYKDKQRGCPARNWSKMVEGIRFGSLIVLKASTRRTNNQTFSLCKCDCGKELEIRNQKIKSGLKKSCGCHRLKPL